MSCGATCIERKGDSRHEAAREKVARFIHAPASQEIIFTRNTTESINLVAYSWGLKNLKPGDVVLTTEMEHHSNLVPWHLIQKQTGCTLRFIPVTEQGTLDLSQLNRLLENVKLASVVHMSNVLGTINPVAKIAEAAHRVGALVLVDGAQSAPHLPVDVQALGCDFFAFSGHKMCGPTGVGVLWSKAEILEAMDPFLGGGEMIHEVWLDRSTYAELPHKFEAGTPAIAQAIGLGAAVDYLLTVGMNRIAEQEHALTTLAIQKMQQVEGLRIFGSAPERGGAISFTLDGIHHHDLSTILDQEGIAIRAGHHCAQPLMKKFGLSGTARVSLYFYNLPEELDVLMPALQKAREIFGYAT
jgi:cysteine desulfurase/selenocysteine lyase